MGWQDVRNSCTNESRSGIFHSEITGQHTIKILKCERGSNKEKKYKQESEKDGKIDWLETCVCVCVLLSRSVFKPL